MSLVAIALRRRRVRAYYSPTGLDCWTFVLGSEQRERDGLFQCLATDDSGRGFSQFTSGQEGPHLGKRVFLPRVPSGLLRHVLRRLTA